MFSEPPSSETSVNLEQSKPSKVLVTRSTLPAFESYCARIKPLWQSRHLTNQGPLVQELEATLQKSMWPQAQVVLVSSGTLALQLLFEAFSLRGAEVLTTPLSFVATVSSLLWQGAKPVFADICPNTWMLDPLEAERQITPETKAILVTPVYGYACDVPRLQALASHYQIPLLLDGAHCFGTEFQGEPLLTLGDASVVSFHATKLFHTVEGGAIITRNEALASKLRQLRDFGFDATRAITEVGINAKLSEFHAAMGLEVLPLVPQAMERRQQRVKHYDRAFASCREVQRIEALETTVPNGAYYPIALPNESAVLRVLAKLEEFDIYARRYFYPCLTQLPYLRQPVSCPMAEDLALRVLCLPIYEDLSSETVSLIAKLVRSNLRS
jgi:dTDP-4-amino-4,6-dideoxygalactose transaminase